MALISWRDGSGIIEKDVNRFHDEVLGFQLFQHLARCFGVDLLAFDKSELKGFEIKCALNVT